MVVLQLLEDAQELPAGRPAIADDPVDEVLVFTCGSVITVPVVIAISMRRPCPAEPVRAEARMDTQIRLEPMSRGGCYRGRHCGRRPSCQADPTVDPQMRRLPKEL